MTNNTSISLFQLWGNGSLQKCSKNQRPLRLLCRNLWQQGPSLLQTLYLDEPPDLTFYQNDRDDSDYFPRPYQLLERGTSRNSQYDEWGMEWRARTGFPLTNYLQKWENLENKLSSSFDQFQMPKFKYLECLRMFLSSSRGRFLEWKILKLLYVGAAVLHAGFKWCRKNQFAIKHPKHHSHFSIPLTMPSVSQNQFSQTIQRSVRDTRRWSGTGVCAFWLSWPRGQDHRI